jgi:hypothetical protein
MRWKKPTIWNWRSTFMARNGTRKAAGLGNGDFAYSEEDGCIMYADELDLD